MSSANSRIRVGVQVFPQNADYAVMRAAWRRAEDLGVDTLLVWDHFLPPVGDRREKHLECWTLLAAMAAVTERAAIGSFVTSASFRNANLLADMARTVDHISAGRLIIGIGAGWFADEFAEYGYEFGTAGSRLSALENALQTIEARLAKLNPGPVRGRIPILVGGGGERLLRIAARHADIWHVFGGLEIFRRKSAALDESCRMLGRDPTEIERAVTLSAGEIEQAEVLSDAGATHVVLNAEGPAYDMAPLAELLQWRDRQAQQDRT